MIRAKVGVFVVGALYASVAGSLYAHAVTFIAPDAFGLLTSIQLLVIATVGGLTSVWGALVGALFVTLVTEGAREVVPLVVGGATGPYEIAVYGLLLVAVLVAFRKGLADGVVDWGARPTHGGSRPRPPSAPRRRDPRRRGSAADRRPDATLRRGGGGRGPLARGGVRGHHRG